jgi:hypothetical protein
MYNLIVSSYYLGESQIADCCWNVERYGLHGLLDDRAVGNRKKKERKKERKKETRFFKGLAYSFLPYMYNLAQHCHVLRY